MMNVDIICTSYSVGDLTRSFLLFVVGQGPNVLLLARVKTLEGYRERESAVINWTVNGNILLEVIVLV